MTDNNMKGHDTMNTAQARAEQETDAIANSIRKTAEQYPDYASLILSALTAQAIEKLAGEIDRCEQEQAIIESGKKLIGRIVCYGAYGETCAVFVAVNRPLQRITGTVWRNAKEIAIIIDAATSYAYAHKEHYYGKKGSWVAHEIEFANWGNSPDVNVTLPPATLE